MSRVNIQLLEEQRVLVTAKLDLTRAFGSTAAYFEASRVARPMADKAILEQLRLASVAINLSTGNVNIPLSPTSIVFAQQTLLEYQSPVEWPRATIQFEGQFPKDLAPQHHSVQVRFSDDFVFEEPIATTLQSSIDELVVSRWLVTLQSSPTLSAPRWFAVDNLKAVIEPATPNSTAFSSYFSLGFWHIIPDGVDHLLFVLALMLGLPTARALLIALSLYTAAHSITFAASALGWLPANLPGVEPMIVVSIVCAAVLNLGKRASTLGHSAMTFGFGLLHGLGFASALGSAGLPTQQRLASLLGFNFGVEAAQLLCILIALPLWWCRRFPWYWAGIQKPLSILIALIGLGWLFTLTIANLIPPE